jgi:restriction system protein
MDFLSAAYRVLEKAQQPLHYKEITRQALVSGFIKTTGKTPEATMGSQLYLDTKREDTRFERAGRGIFKIKAKARTDEIAKRVERINDSTRRMLKKRLHEMPADRFEELISLLLKKIGFDEATVQVTSYSGDGGIDVRGILNAGDVTEVNAAVQVKRWKGNVQARTVRDVRGSLTTHEQGIIITTSDFSKGAKAEANAIGKTPISLVNGAQLIELLIKHSVGVNKEQHTVFSLDQEWWNEIIEIEDEGTPTPEKEPISVKIELDYPVIVRALNNPNLIGQLLNAEGHMIFNDQKYTSPSTAGKDASGWKSCNGWKYWQYQNPETKEWRLIDDLRRL